MPGDVDASISTIDHLRQEVLSINERQVAGVDQAELELVRTQLALELARDQADQGLSRAKAAYQRCQFEAEAAAQAGAYGPDCSGLEHEVKLAQERLERIARAIHDVEQTGDRFRRAASSHRAYISHAIPAMRSGLLARAVSVAEYLSFLVTTGTTAASSSAANSTRALADDIGAKQSFGSFRIPNPTERRDRWGSGERGG